MEVQLFKTDSRDALFSLYMFFLKKQGIKVTYENIGGKMRGGNTYFEEMVGAIFLAFVFFIAINIKFPQNSAELYEALNETAKNPESVVTDLIENNKVDLLKAQEIIEDFGVDRVYEIKDNFEGTMDPIFKNKTKNGIIKSIIGVGANAMKIIEEQAMDINFGDVYSFNTETVAGENTTKTSSPKRGKYLEKYIENYEKAVRTTNEKGSSPKRNEFGIFSKVASTVSDEMPVASTVSDEMPVASTVSDEMPVASTVSDEMPVASEANIVKENTSSTQKRMSPLAQRYLDAANKRGGSKTRGQKRKIVESKRKSGGSKKQKRRSHKRK